MAEETSTQNAVVTGGTPAARRCYPSGNLYGLYACLYRCVVPRQRRTGGQQAIRTGNEKETLAQVFTDVRYTKANNEYFSDVLLKVLKDQGFMK